MDEIEKAWLEAAYHAAIERFLDEERERDAHLPLVTHWCPGCEAMLDVRAGVVATCGDCRRHYLQVNAG